MVRTYFSVLEQEDLFKLVLSDWLTPRELIQFDSALSGQKRETVHNVLRCVPMTQPYADKVELWWKHHKAIFQWMASRQIYKTTGLWCLHEKIWPVLHDGQEFRPILEAMEIMRFENFNPGFDLNQLSVCQNLLSLEMYNFDKDLSASSVTEVICPKLERIYLQGCKIGDGLLAAFSRCERLVDVSYFHNTYGEFATMAAGSQELALRFFNRIRSFSVVATVNNVLSTHLPPGNLPFTSVTLDNVHRNEANTQQLAEFLPRCPDVENLTIARCRFDFATVLKAIREQCRAATCLHLNHCRWLRAENETEAQELPVVDPSDRLAKLLITTALPMFDADLDLILKMCAQNVQDLQVSFCARLTPQAYTTIRNRVPMLRTLLVEYSEEDGYFTSEHMDAVQKQFANLPQLQIVKWDVWLTEQMKATSLHQRTVMLDKHNN